MRCLATWRCRQCSVPKPIELMTSEPATPPPPQEHAERVVPYLARILQQHLLADPDTPYWTARRHRAVRRRLRLHAAVRAARAEGPRGRGADHRHDRRQLRVDPQGRLRERRQPAQVRRRRAPPVVPERGPRRARLRGGGADARDARRRRPDRAAGREASRCGCRRACTRETFISSPSAPRTSRCCPPARRGAERSAMEHAAEAGEILVSAETAAFLPADLLGDPKASGVLLLGEPPGHDEKIPYIPRPKMLPESLLRCLSPAIRAHVLAGGGTSEHRPVTIAFIRFEGTDALIGQGGAAAAAEALHRVVSIVEAATEEQGIAFLGSDVDADGGKLILTAGAPTATGDDEDRMLLALRKIVESDLPDSVAHRRSPRRRIRRRHRTRVSPHVHRDGRRGEPDRATDGQGGAGPDLRDRRRARSLQHAVRDEQARAVHGERERPEPVQAWSVGRAEGSRTRQVTLQRLPLTGRNAELGVIRKAFTSARSGAGRLIEVVGDSGIGKTRLLEALRDGAAGFNKQHATCEAYTSSIPYVVWRELLREMLAFGRDSPEAEIIERHPRGRGDQGARSRAMAAAARRRVRRRDRRHPEVLQLAEKNRRTKLQETVARFLEVEFPDKLLVEIDDAHHMDEASAELLAHLTGGSRRAAVALRRCAPTRRAPGSRRAEAPEVVRIDLKPIAPQDALRLAQIATAQSPLPPHVLEVVATALGRQPAVPARPVARGHRIRRRRRSARVRGSGDDDADRHAAAGGPRPGPPRRGVRPDVPPADGVVALFRGGRPGTRRIGARQTARAVRRGARRVPALSPDAAARLRLRGAAVPASAATA